MRVYAFKYRSTYELVAILQDEIFVVAKFYTISKVLKTTMFLFLKKNLVLKLLKIDSLKYHNVGEIKTK